MINGDHFTKVELTPEGFTRYQLSEAAKGNQYALGRRYRRSAETKRKLSEAGKGRHCSKETRQKLSEALKCCWQDPRHARKVLAHKNLNEGERKLDTILQALFPGKFALNIRAEVMVLGGKVPDFVNVNGKKQVIELWGNWWHRHDDPQDRIDYFKQFGWNTLIIWERELKDEVKLKQRLRAFIATGDG